jgi:hypothetical protein
VQLSQTSNQDLYQIKKENQEVIKVNVKSKLSPVENVSYEAITGQQVGIEVPWGGIFD